MTERKAWCPGCHARTWQHCGTFRVEGIPTVLFVVVAVIELATLLTIRWTCEACGEPVPRLAWINAPDDPSA